MRTYVGLFIWILLIAGCVGLWFARPALFEPARRLVAYTSQPSCEVDVALPASVDAKVGTLVMTPDATSFLRRVGRVAAVERDGALLRLALYPAEAETLGDRMRATYFTVPGNAAWVVSTLVPRERLDAVRELWRAFYERERAGIYDTLWPVVKESLEDLFKFYEKEVPRVLDAHRDRLSKLVEKHRSGAFETELLPIVQTVAWDVAQREFTPLVEEIGREIWARLPVWGLTWRFAYQSIPFTGDEHVKKRFEEFLKRDGIPVLQARSAELLEAVARVMKMTLEDPKVSAALRKTAGEVASDPEFLALVRELAADLTVRNDRLRTLLKERWEHKGLKRAVTEVGTRFEPLIKDAINSIVLSPDGKKLNARLSQVLRSRVLKKDEAWVLVEPAGGGPLRSGATIEGRIDGGS